MFDPVTESPMTTYLRYLERGELAYQYSPAADAAIFYPRLICPLTGSDRLEWRVSGGYGTVHAVTVLHSKEARHNVVLVDVDEGFRLLSRVEGIDPAAVAIGMRVKVRIHRPEGNEAPYPVFDPVSDPLCDPLSDPLSDPLFDAMSPRSAPASTPASST